MEHRSPLNVILITLDAFSYEKFIENLDSLPVLEALKNQSASFENAFSVGPTTFFAFPGIIAGVYPYHFGVGIDVGVKAIDEILKCYGYNTAQITDTNLFLTPYFGYGLHTDYLRLIIDQPEGEASRRIEDALLRGGDIDEVRLHPGPQYPPKLPTIILKLRSVWTRNRWIMSFGKYCVSVIWVLSSFIRRRNTVAKRRELYRRFRDQVLEFVNREFRCPQLLWIHASINHMPYLPIEHSSAFSANQVNYLNARAMAGLLNKKICARLESLYVESLKMTDRFISDIFRVLGGKGLLQNSIVVMTADHGEEFMEEGYFGHYGESSSDRLLHVPLLFYCPNLIEAKSISTPVSTIDILPTVCDLLGIGIPDTNRGLSLKQMLLNSNEDMEEAQQRPLFSESWRVKRLLNRSAGHTSNHRTFTVRQGIYKLKVDQMQAANGTDLEKLELWDWVSCKKLEIGSNRQVVEQLMHQLDSHIHDEEVFAREVRRAAEKQRIKSTVLRMRSNGD